MELVNVLYHLEAELSAQARREICEKLTLLLAPFAPFCAEELWTFMGRTGPVFKQPWPEYDEDLAREEGCEVVLQVNGKLRGRMTVPHGTPNEELERLALADGKLSAYWEGKTIVKVIVVPEKLVNVVVR
jgi:leucyl-tRNA synthetase